MGDLIHRDSDWAAFDGLMCRVDDFQPLEGFGPRGILTLTCIERGPNEAPFRASVFHKLDAAHLRAALIERGVADDEEAIIVWTKTYYYAYAKLFKAFMPRMVVMIFKKRSLQLLMDNSLEPELRGVERLKAELPVAEWKPHPLT